MEPNFLQRRFLGLWQFCVEFKSNARLLQLWSHFHFLLLGTNIALAKSTIKGCGNLANTFKPARLLESLRELRSSLESGDIISCGDQD